ncbi:MAG TPA: MauE/DoxX family redox-associated membrane protein [Planctomycetota bacterium]|nr:MauE/DoxX family redox-associated membrane protein [Planctomycetota bacterium]
MTRDASRAGPGRTAQPAPPDARRPGALDALTLMARLILGGTFLVLGALKIGDPVGFLKAVRQFGVVADTDPTLLNAVAAWLPWIEVSCGLLLLLGAGVRGAALIVLAMLLVFTPAIASRGIELRAAGGGPFCDIAFDCGCGTGVVNVCSKLAQNAALIGLALLALLSRSTRFCLRPQLLAPPARSSPTCR